MCINSPFIGIIRWTVSSGVAEMKASEQNGFNKTNETIREKSEITPANDKCEEDVER